MPNALASLYDELLRGGYRPDEIPDVIRQLAPLGPTVEDLQRQGYSAQDIPSLIATGTTPSQTVAGGYGLLDPATRAYAAALDAATRTAQTGVSLVDTLTRIMSEPFSLIPALQVYGALGGQPNIAQAVLQARGGEPAPPIFGQQLSELVQALTGQVIRGVSGQPQSPVPRGSAQQGGNRAPLGRPAPARATHYIDMPASGVVVGNTRYAARGYLTDEGLRKFLAKNPWAAPYIKRLAHGGTLPVDEPMLGVGLRTQLPRFLVGEQGPELMTVRPVPSGSKPPRQSLPLPFIHTRVPWMPLETFLQRIGATLPSEAQSFIRSRLPATPLGSFLESLRQAGGKLPRQSLPLPFIHTGIPWMPLETFLRRIGGTLPSDAQRFVSQLKAPSPDRFTMSPRNAVPPY